MKLSKHIKDYIIETIGLALFVFGFARIVIILFSEDLSKIYYHILVLILAIILMGYKNLPHTLKKMFVG